MLNEKLKNLKETAKKKAKKKDMPKKEVVNRVKDKIIAKLSLPSEYLDFRLKDLNFGKNDKKIKNKILDFYREIDFQKNKNVDCFLYSEGIATPEDEKFKLGTGTGKTVLAYVVLEELIKKYIRFLYEKHGSYLLYDTSLFKKDFCQISSCEFFNKLIADRREFDYTSIKKAKQEVKTAKILVWDDILSEERNDWVLNQIQEIIDYRTKNGKNTIYTSNFKSEHFLKIKSDDEDSQKQAQRIYSRLKGGCKDYIINIEGIDRRIFD